MGGTLAKILTSLKYSKRFNILLHKCSGFYFQIGGKVKSVTGKPGEAICQVASDENVTFIVTGTRGLGRIKRTLVGSVSDYILHHAHCPCIVVKQK